jgi:peptide/nickel transport system substrate-binding protein
MVLYALHDAVVKPMPGQPMAPCLAQSFAASEDGLSYEFVLRENAKFHNGDPVTAEDVKFSFERYRGASHDLIKDRVEAVETLDPQHLRLRLKAPWSDFLTFYATASGAGWVVPKKYVEQVGDEGFKKAPVGAGPYKFVSFTPGVELVFEAFDQYWRKTPSVKRLVFKVIPDETTRLAALQRGEIDIVYSIRGELAEELKRTPGLTLKPVVPQGPWWIYFPEQWDPKSPWHDERVRRAASLAIDRKGINDAITLGYSKITGSIIPYTFECYWPPPEPVYDPAKAKQLLAEAGYANGFDAGEHYVDSSYSNFGEAVLDNLLTVGIRATLRPLRAGRLFRGIFEPEVQERDHPSSQRRLWQRRDAPRCVRRQGRPLCLWQQPRNRCPLSAASRRARPQAARGDPEQNSAAGLRTGDLFTAAAARFHQRCRTAGRRIRVWPDPGLRLHGSIRGHHDKGYITKSCITRRRMLP